MRPTSVALLFSSALILSSASSSPALAETREKISPKVLVITMFDQEAKPWLENENFSQKIALPGLSEEYPNIDCTDAGLCHVTTAMGFANAASTASAIALSDKFDLTDTYILIAGIAGVDPKHGTLGSALWAKYAVDAGLKHRIDLREAPKNWETDTFALGAGDPESKPEWAAGTEVYALNPALADYALELTRNVELMDGDIAQEYRKHYSQEAAQSAPSVSTCDTLSGDTYWHGAKIAEAMEKWVALQTDGKGTYCTSQMEDNATLTALKRAADAGLLDFNRIALLRTASNFDRQGDNVSAFDSLKANSGGFPLATENAYRVGKVYADNIINNWDKWQASPQTDLAK